MLSLTLNDKPPVVPDPSEECLTGWRVVRSLTRFAEPADTLPRNQAVAGFLTEIDYLPPRPSAGARGGGEAGAARRVNGL